jgi:hypothetical protein
VDEGEAEESQAHRCFGITHCTHVFEVIHHITEVLLQSGHAALSWLGITSDRAELVHLSSEGRKPIIHNVRRRHRFSVWD